MHEDITCLFGFLESENKVCDEQSEVSLNKYGHHHILTNYFILVREILPLLKNTTQRLGYQ